MRGTGGRGEEGTTTRTVDMNIEYRRCLLFCCHTSQNIYGVRHVP